MEGQEAVLQAVSGQGIANKAWEVYQAVEGRPYTWGGKTTAGFDCSGFVSHVFKQLFPNQAGTFQLTAAGFAASSMFVQVTDAEKQAGDLIYFPPNGGLPAHIGIVYDNQRWLGSQSSTGVKPVPFSQTWWGARPHRFYRMQNLSTLSMQSSLLNIESGAWA